MLPHQRLQPPLLRLQQPPLLVGLLLLQQPDLARPAGLVLDALVLRPQLPLLGLLALKLLLDPPHHPSLDLPQLLQALAVAAVYLLQLPLDLQPPLEGLMLGRGQFDAVAVLVLDLVGELLLEELD